MIARNWWSWQNHLIHTQMWFLCKENISSRGCTSLYNNIEGLDLKMDLIPSMFEILSQMEQLWSVYEVPPYGPNFILLESILPGMAHLSILFFILDLACIAESWGHFTHNWLTEKANFGKMLIAKWKLRSYDDDDDDAWHIGHNDITFVTISHILMGRGSFLIHYGNHWQTVLLDAVHTV